MDTSSADFISLRVSLRAANNIAMIGVVVASPLRGSLPPWASAAIKVIAYKSRPNIVQ
jgi:hypothetical protein